MGIENDHITATAIRQPKVFISRPLKTQATWDKPLDSIDFDVPPSVERERTRFGKLVEYRFWAIKGRALDAYSSIENDIQRCLSFRDDLFEGENESALPSSIDCYMVGRKAQKASPHITISCESVKYCRKVIEIIRESDWWLRFINDFPGFKFIHLRNRPRPVRMAGHDGSAPLVYTFSHSSGISGIPLFLSPVPLTEVDATRQPNSTMGGLVLVNGKLLGLTVAHAIFDNAESIIPGGRNDNPSDVSTFSFMEEAEDESEDDSMSDTESETSYTGSSGHSQHTSYLQPGSVNNIPSSSELPVSVSLVGHLTRRSAGDSSDAEDWALIELDWTWSRLHGIMTFPRYPGPDIFSQNVPNAGTLGSEALDPLPPLPKHAIEVFVLNETGERVKGILKPNKTLIGLRHGRRPLQLYCVILTVPIHPGDCGKWLLDSDGNWYGHIVAGLPASNTVYVAPACEIQDAIKSRLLAQSVLAPEMESTISRTDHIAERVRLFPGQPLLLSFRSLEDENFSTQKLPKLLLQIPEDYIFNFVRMHVWGDKISRHEQSTSAVPDASSISETKESLSSVPVNMLSSSLDSDFKRADPKYMEEPKSVPDENEISPSSEHSQALLSYKERRRLLIAESNEAERRFEVRIKEEELDTTARALEVQRELFSTKARYLADKEKRLLDQETSFTEEKWQLARERMNMVDKEMELQRKWTDLDMTERSLATREQNVRVMEQLLTRERNQLDERGEVLRTRERLLLDQEEFLVEKRRQSTRVHMDISNKEMELRQKETVLDMAEKSLARRERNVTPMENQLTRLEKWHLDERDSALQKREKEVEKAEQALLRAQQGAELRDIGGTKS